MDMSSSPSQHSERVGVIDVGSNTIKLLVAARGKNSSLEIVDLVVDETRIGESMTGNPPRIDRETIDRAATAIHSLCQKAQGVKALRILATSAVRDAENGDDFVSEVEKRANHSLTILSGDEEARLIGIGLRHDPSVREIADFSLMDLGGGSLECVQFIGHKPLRAQSLRLGSVRLASLLLNDRAAPLSLEEERELTDYVTKVWSASRFPADSSPSDVAVLTGGSASNLSEMLDPQTREQGISIEEFSELKRAICAAPLAERVARFTIPASRADIFPTAMVTLEASLRYLGCRRIRFSHYNLRYGAAAELLDQNDLAD